MTGSATVSRTRLDRSHEQAAAWPQIADFLAFLTLRGRTPATLDAYDRVYARLCVMYPGTPLSEVTSEHLMRVLLAFPEGSRPQAYSAFSSLFTWACSWGHVEASPMRRLFRPQPRVRDDDRYQVFELAEEQALCDGPLELRDRALMAVMFGAGLRKGECCRLLLGHVDLGRGLVRVTGGKSRAARRVIPVGERVTQALVDLSLLDGVGNDQFLWYSTRGASRVVRRDRPLSAGSASFYRWWSRCLEEAGVGYRNPHSTRHTFATRYLQAGGRLPVLSMLLGHSSVDITMRFYAHLTTEDLAADVARVLREREGW